MLKRFALSPAGQVIIGFLAAGYIWLVRWTSRLEYVDREPVDRLLQEGRPILGVIWHGRLLIAPYAWVYDAPQYYLISRHSDGELIARVMRLMGADTVRGSAANPLKDDDKGGAAAMREILRLLRAGRSVGLTPDGPRGPRMRMSEGTVTIARLSGTPVVPVSYASTRRLILKSWDRFHLPLPFSRIFIVYSTPTEVPRHLDDAEAEQWRRRLETALNEATARADRLAGKPVVEPAAEPAQLGEHAP